MHVPALDIDTVIAATLVVSALYGMTGGAARLRNLILATYAGIVLAQTFTAIAMPYAKGVSADIVGLALLAAPIVLFVLLHRGHSDKGSGVLNLILGFAAGLLIVAAGLHAIAPSTETQVGQNSFLAMIINSFYLWIIGLMPIAAVIPQLLEKTKKPSHH